jgi:hypothetical protein
MMPAPNADQIEALALLMEDCAEVIHQAGKMLRHGVGLSTDQNTGVYYDNAALLIKELAQLDVAVSLVGLLLDLDQAKWQAARKERLEQLPLYLHRSVNESIVRGLWKP